MTVPAVMKEPVQAGQGCSGGLMFVPRHTPTSAGCAQTAPASTPGSTHRQGRLPGRRARTAAPRYRKHPCTCAMGCWEGQHELGCSSSTTWVLPRQPSVKQHLPTMHDAGTITAAAGGGQSAHASNSMSPQRTLPPQRQQAAGTRRTLKALRTHPALPLPATVAMAALSGSSTLMRWLYESATYTATVQRSGASRDEQR